MIRILFLVLFVLFLSTGCKEKTSLEHTNYSHISSWAIINGGLTGAEVDVFYIYPTVFEGDEVPCGNNMDIHAPLLRQQAQNTINQQIGVFSHSARVFAPYYQQVSKKTLMKNDSICNEYITIAYNDVEAAFDYYLEHFNNNRPFILAGHSQGSMLLLELMNNRFHEKYLMDKLVAAYTIGYTLNNQNSKSWMNIASKKDDIGVIILYNSVGFPEADSPSVKGYTECINPLNWSNKENCVSNIHDINAVWINNEGKDTLHIPHFTGAYIANNGKLVLEIPEQNLKYVSDVTDGVYHKYDYTLFYQNLQQNVKTRINSYLKKRPGT